MVKETSDEERSNPTWLYVSSLEGERTSALFPYAQLRNILTREDVRLAVADECRLLEEEFGTALLEPFFDLIWLMNTNAGMFTTHTNVAPADRTPPFAWARTQVAAQIICLSRESWRHQHLPSSEALAAWLRRLVGKQNPPRNTTGWMIATGPTPMTLLHLRHPDVPYPYCDGDIIERAGFGCVLRIRGCANSRSSAAERFQAAVSFVRDTFKRALDSGEVPRAEPTNMSRRNNPNPEPGDAEHPAPSYPLRATKPRMP